MELQPSVSPPRPATFYGALEPFTEFADVADPERYVAAPEDWIVVLGDIKGSTEAARAGRYKEVNLVGAACITATLNVTGDLDLPYAFGGDGATMLIPPEVRDAVEAALRRTRRLARDGFGLELRLGLIAVQELRRRGRRRARCQTSAQPRQLPRHVRRRRSRARRPADQERCGVRARRAGRPGAARPARVCPAAGSRTARRAATC